MTLTTTGFSVRCIDPTVVEALLIRDDLGHVPRLVVDDEGGSPLRCCLRLSEAGEQIALVSYAPLRRWAQSRQLDVGPYDEVGPIFIHATPCGGRETDVYPADLRSAPRMFRAYSSQGRILGGVLVDAHGPFDETLQETLADSAVAVVHARAVSFGCFTFEVGRQTPCEALAPAPS